MTVLNITYENAEKADVAQIEGAHTDHFLADESKHEEGVVGTHDAVFGTQQEGGPNYRSVGWIQTMIIMTKTQISLGVLGIPSTFNTLGLVPGIIALTSITILTGWSNYMIGKFKLRHPEMYGLDSAGFMMFGKPGREAMLIILQLYYLITVGSAFIGISTCLNALSEHGACTAVFIAVAAIVGFLTSSVRTMSKIGMVAWIGLICIMVSLITLAISLSQQRPVLAPQTGPWESDWKAIGSPSFTEVATAISSIIFSLSSPPYFCSILAEMREPKDYTKAMICSQSIVYSLYLIIGVIVYYYAGSLVTSPALGTAGPLMKKICYGIALPGLLVSTMIICHVPAKIVFVRILRNSKHLSANTVIHWATWLSCTLGTCIIGYIIASTVPSFGTIIGLIGALFGTFITLQIFGAMWLFDNRPGSTVSRKRWIAGACWAIFIIVVGFFFQIAGTYGSIVEIKALYHVTKQGAWSCKDNSGLIR
ncbi:hypothetical protein BU24DRAFT_435348 [Aaosphaeria arxii CBS 175.79]|uniref:Amino acid transporter transmembrane domain-containing protein n=1 Tax=Aaosphaeria arxii CBS 175.79 TaxID=1450172 RepID=A0A6A5XF06_9PLEO|nr:uncharacterized protein BU24DRAFT_435348 [Aaosphaeria arxii CBS 175.79]KAF2011825.1 hypothetical protein BU24DRAFT_435348 [Aaosphaeria arxii CBS 175.79]